MTATVVGPGGKVEVDNDTGPPITVFDAAAVAVLEQIEASVGGLVPMAYDEIDLGYTGGNLTSVVYSLADTVVRTLTLTYLGSDLIKVQAT